MSDEDKEQFEIYEKAVVGSKLGIRVQRDLRFAYDPSSKIIEATVIAEYGHETNISFVIQGKTHIINHPPFVLGWNEKETIPHQAYPITPNRKKGFLNSIKNIDTYTHMWVWYQHDILVSGILNTNTPISINKNPLKCIGCFDIALFAEPNQPDGKFKCYSCRKYPFYQ